MRSPQELRDFKVSLSKSLAKKCECTGNLCARITGDASSCMCECKRTYVFQTEAYRACIPRKFWEATDEDVYHNKAVYTGVIKQFTSNYRIAMQEGAGIFLHGPNGCGKSMFLSLLLMHAIRNTRLSCYYTTAIALDQNLKRTFGNSKEAEARAIELRELTRSHLLVLDELGKEKLREGDSWARREIETLLRYREEENLPILIASNRNILAIRAPVEDGGYGETIGSIFDGSCIEVPMTPGDQRAKKGKTLHEKMGF